MKWYQRDSREILDEWKVDSSAGLSFDDARRRLLTYGRNELAHHKAETLLDIFVRQFKSPLIYILIFAAALVVFIGEKVDAIVILAVIIVNAVVGTIQEGKAKNSLERLRHLTRHKALVRRDGEEALISSDEVVPGDILILKEGDSVTADARIINSESLKVNESILTGEALAVAKISSKISKDNLVVGDQKNMVFAGTSLVSGYCEAVVVTTGFDSELGKISKEVLETSDIPLPLANKILKLTHFLALVLIGVSALLFVLGILRGLEFQEIIGVVIGLSVSIIPEGLPVAVTIVLAGGVWRMAKHKAVIRQLAAVEAMGNADALLVDKTGTITTGQMVIRQVNLGGKLVEVTGEGYEPEGEIKISDEKDKTKLTKLLSLCLLSLKANVVHEEHSGWRPSGDPTEAAIAALCLKAGLSREKLSQQYETDFARPFDSKKRYIEASFKKGKEKWHVLVGAPEFVSKQLKEDKEFLDDYHKLTADGLRVVGLVIFGPVKKKLFGSALLAIEEEVRHEVKDSVVEAKKAGFRVVMMTGDFENTARAIAAKVGIFEAGDTILTGEDVERLQEIELEQKIDKVSVFARITPEHKLKIVKVFKKKGHITAMTGDGVNDAPALQAANLGIGLGSGTQVAKDSSDIVLVDDNFSTIVNAIREGRAIYLTLKEVILYLLSTSTGEVFVILGSILIGLPLPLVAVQIIWLNFVTDGFFVVALAQDQPTKKELKSKRDVDSENLVDQLMIKRILLMGTVMMLVTLPVFNFYKVNYSLEYARTMALLVLAAFQWFNALNVRSRTRSIFSIPLNNKFFNMAFILVLVLQFVAIETAIGNRILHTENITVGQWVIAIALATSIIWVEEIRKWIVRRNA